MFSNIGFLKKAGESNIDLGAQVKIKKLKGEDSYLSGLVGTATHPFAFGCTNKGWIGIYLDNNTKVNVKENEVNVIEEKFTFKQDHKKGV